VPERPDPADRLSIVHVCAPAHVGGLERVVQGLATGQDARGHTVRVLAVVEPDAVVEPFAAPMRAVGVEVRVLRMAGRAYLRELREVGRILRTWAPDVLHTHGYRSDLLHGWSARRARIATVSTLHGSSRMGGVSHLFEWIQERALGRFDAVVAVSAPLVEALAGQGVPRDRIHMVPNAWTPPEAPLTREEARRELGVSDGERVIGWVGRLIPVKGVDVLVEALGRMQTSGWVARIVGDGPERAAAEARVRALDLDGAVRFLGAVPDAARLFRGLDLFVLSSRSEGTPMVLLEAMGEGLPVVATRVGGVPDVLRAPGEGWIVPPEAPDALAMALDEAVAGSDVRATRGAAARARIESTFDMAAWIRRHDAVYRAALANRRSG
jgi:glycosyltransferase involved in cell wall biosynthesis